MSLAATGHLLLLDVSQHQDSNGDRLAAYPVTPQIGEEPRKSPANPGSAEDVPTRQARRRSANAAVAARSSAAAARPAGDSVGMAIDA
jgi:hypothetical protein